MSTRQEARKEIRRQVRRGWVDRRTAASLLGFDLDHKRLDAMLDQHLFTTKGTGSKLLVNAHQVMAKAGKDLDAVLNRILPIDRRKRDVPAKEFRVLKSATARTCFQRQWDRLHRHVSRLIAAPDKKKKTSLSHGELKLIHQLLEAARFYNRFDLHFTSAELQDATGLNDEYLSIARRSLEDRDLMKSENKFGTAGWKITLFDPKTGSPFEDCAADKAPRKAPDVIPSSGWNSWDDD